VLLRFEKAVLGYGGTAVLSGVDLIVRRGDFLGLVGPNGAGKTTLLRGAIGVLKPDSGRIRVGPGEEHEKSIVIGYVPQVQSLDPIYPLTVGEVVLMGGYKRFGLLGRPGRKELSFLQQCLADVGMSEQARRLFSSLSAGQKQRVLIARALFTSPDLLLLDEPTSGADHNAEKSLMDLLNRLNTEGHTIVLVCHELDVVRKAVKEILWVSRGCVLRDSPSALLSEGLINEMYGA